MASLLSYPKRHLSNEFYRLAIQSPVDDGESNFIGKRFAHPPIGASCEKEIPRFTLNDMIRSSLYVSATVASWSKPLLNFPVVFVQSSLRLRTVILSSFYGPRTTNATTDNSSH